MTIGAMILAAGRGERMRPLSDVTPKPLLEVGGKPLIVWQIEALARAGLRDIVINVAHLADRFVARLGDGRALGVRLSWSIEPAALETAGGIATALPLLPAGPALIVSADVWSCFDSPRLHLVMVPNPPYHPAGDYALVAGDAETTGRLALGGAPRLTYGNIGLYDTALFGELPRGAKLKLAPYLSDWIDRGLASAQRYRGPWANVGTPEDLARLDAALGAPPASGSSTPTTPPTTPTHRTRP